MTDRPTERRGQCVACGGIGTLRLIRPSRTATHRIWKCVTCIERRHAFIAARRKATGIDAV